MNRSSSTQSDITPNANGRPGSQGPCTPSENTAGYLGFTSFDAVYRETQDSLSLIQGTSSESSPWTKKDDSGTTTGSPRRTANAMSPRTMEICLAVLRQLPNDDVALALFLKHTNPNDGWLRTAARRLVESLQDTFRREIRLRKTADLERMAQLISDNTAKSWTDNESDADKWLASFSGRNLRWDALGILFTYCTPPPPNLHQTHPMATSEFGFVFAKHGIPMMRICLSHYWSSG